MKIINIEELNEGPVYDISVEGNQQYCLKNKVVSHNTGSYYGADNIWVIGRQQEKDGTEINGYHFVINVEKSRFIKEKSKIPITLTYENGINKWSGLLDLALEGGYIIKPKVGWYNRVDKETGEILGKSMRAGDFVDNTVFWLTILKETDLADYIENKYVLTMGEIMEDKNDLDLEEGDDE